jgi:hypothetical protein
VPLVAVEQLAYRFRRARGVVVRDVDLPNDRAVRAAVRLRDSERGAEGIGSRVRIPASWGGLAELSAAVLTVGGCDALILVSLGLRR